MRGTVYALNKTARRMIAQGPGGYSLLQLDELSELDVGHTVVWALPVPGRQAILTDTSCGRQHSVLSVRQGIRADHVGLYLYAEDSESPTCQS